MDGVLVDSERVSLPEDHAFFAGVFGDDIANKIGDAMGVSAKDVYDIAVSNGSKMEKSTFYEKIDARSRDVYARSKLEQGVQPLVEYLVSNGFKLALVSATRYMWLEHILDTLGIRNKFAEIISINDTPGLRSKPAPDGFLEALRRLDADPKRSFVLEDSNRGIAAGKASGCFVIGYRGLLMPGYVQDGADEYTDTMEGVVEIVIRRSQT